MVAPFARASLAHAGGCLFHVDPDGGRNTLSCQRSMGRKPVASLPFYPLSVAFSPPAPSAWCHCQDAERARSPILAGDFVFKLGRPTVAARSSTNSLAGQKRPAWICRRRIGFARKRTAISVQSGLTIASVVKGFPVVRTLVVGSSPSSSTTHSGATEDPKKRNCSTSNAGCPTR